MGSTEDAAHQLLDQAEALETLSQELSDRAVELRKLALVLGSRPDSPPPSRFSPKTPLVSGGVEP